MLPIFILGLLSFGVGGAKIVDRDTVMPSASTTGSVNDSNHDLSQHFCRIYRHASVYADGHIYIDGGNIYIPNNNQTFDNSSAGSYTLGMNDQLLVLNLSENFTTQDMAPYRSLHKGPGVPNALIESSLLYSAATRKVTQIGGWFSYNSQTDPGYISDNELPAPSIWQFDIDSEAWDQATEIDYSGYGQKVERPGAAAYCDAPTLNKSFVFEGHVWHRSDPEYNNYVLGEDMKFLEGMMVLDTSTPMATPTLTNISAPVSLDGGDHPFGPRMNGAMVHVPVGDMGVLIFIGGQTTQNPTAYGVNIPHAAQSNVMIDNTFVDIYDIQTGFWFRQQTFGVPDIPTGRTDICTVLVTALDNSSYNIYMVGGMSNYKTYIATEEIWVLTLPTFQWVLVHTRPEGRYGHTCHAVGENLLLVGGMQTEPDGQDVQTCSDTMPAEVFNLYSQNYTGIYDIGGAKRMAPVPLQVTSVIGGTSTGGAVVKTPKLWSDVYLQYVFNPSLERPEYTPTYTLANGTGSGTANSADNGDKRPRKGIIIGGAVGGAVGGLLIMAFIVTFFTVRLRRKKQAEAAASPSQTEQQRGSPPGLSSTTYWKNDRSELESQIRIQGYPAELYNSMELAELDISRRPVELFTPLPLSEVSGSPISTPGTTFAAHFDGSEISPELSYHRSFDESPNN